MRKYEIMFIVRPTLTEDEIKAAGKTFEKVLTENGANITNYKELGQKELAYEINDFNTGYYFLINLESNDDKAIKEFDRLALISKDVIRHLITKLED